MIYDAAERSGYQCCCAEKKLGLNYYDKGPGAKGPDGLDGGRDQWEAVENYCYLDKAYNSEPGERGCHTVENPPFDYGTCSNLASKPSKTTKCCPEGMTVNYWLGPGCSWDSCPP